MFAGLVVLAHLALSGKWNAYFLLRRMQTLGGWHIGARVKKLEVKNELIAKTLASVN